MMCGSEKKRDILLGCHILLDAWDISVKLLNDPEYVEAALIGAVAACEATLIDVCVHKFSPHGVTAMAVLAESHISIHTWPEYGYIGVDLFFCGSGNPERAVEYLAQSFEMKEIRVEKLARGLGVLSL